MSMDIKIQVVCDIYLTYGFLEEYDKMGIKKGLEFDYFELWMLEIQTPATTIGFIM